MDNNLAVRTFDRRLYMVAAIAFAVIVVAGFSRTYYMKALLGGPPLPSTLVHVHGILMTTWVALFGVQVWFISSKRVRLHQRFGYAAIGLAALIIVVGFFTAVGAAKYGSSATPPGIAPLPFLIVPLFDLWMFVVLFGGAIYYRKKPAAHKSLMLLTAVNFLPPALARIPLPSLQALGPVWFFGLPAVMLLLCAGLDWRRRGHLNVVFATGIVLLVGSYVVRLALMGTDAWLQIAGWLTTFV